VKDPNRPSAALQTALFPHEIEQRAPRAAEGPNFSALGPEVHHPRGGHPGPPPRPTQHFTANTCRKCRHITIAGLWVGLRIDLEPQVLTDLDEYHAIRDGIRTWNLYPDRTAKPRDVTAIRYRTVTDRHARHTCGHTYGTQPATSHQALSTAIPDEPQF